MPAYDTEEFNPPAPLARVSLRSPHNGLMLNDVPMLIDSGSDVTLIPKTVVSELKLVRRDRIRSRVVFWGKKYDKRSSNGIDFRSTHFPRPVSFD